jgi:hypothetical protein
VKNEEKEIRSLFNEFYAEDPEVGDWVIIKNTYTETVITGEVVGVKRYAPARGFQEEAEFEFIIYHGLQLKIGSIRGWFNIETNDWAILNIMSDFEHKKLPKRERREQE